MPFVVIRDRWRRQPLSGRVRFDLSHWAARGIWAASNTADRAVFDLLRGQAATSTNMTGRSTANRRSAFGPVAGFQHVSGVPYHSQRGRFEAPTSSSMTVAAIVGGSGFQQTRVNVAASLAGFSIPGIHEGPGTVWRAYYRTASSTDVVADGTTASTAAGPARFVVARLTNGVGLSLWVDGIEEAFTSSTLNMVASPALMNTNPGPAFVDVAPLALAWARALSDYEIQTLSRNPWQVLRQMDRAVFYSVGAGATDLVIQGADHSHSADNVVLTQAHVLAVADALHAHSADNVVLTQAHTLVTQDAGHAHAVDSANLTQSHVLAVADATHGHAADGVTLTQQHALAIADALHAHSAEQPTLSVEGDLIIADVFHTHAADGIVLTQAHVLAVSDALHGHAADGITLTLEGDLVVSDAVHAHLAEALSLTQAHFLVVSDAVHQHLADVLSLSIPGSGVEDSNRVLVVRAAGRTLVLLRASRVLSVAPAARSLSVH